MDTLRWTVHDLELMPDDGSRYEIIDGELYVSSPIDWIHQFVVGEIVVPPTIGVDEQSEG